MIDNGHAFEKLFNNTFGAISKETLSKTKEKIRIELSGETGVNGLQSALSRAYEILQYNFNNKAIWLRIILWSKEEEEKLQHAGFQFGKMHKFFRQIDDEGNQVLYFQLNRYSKAILAPLIISIINFDLAEEPSANLTCYFISFKSKLIINIYDDRGVDVFSTNRGVLNNIMEIFADWIIY